MPLESLGWTLSAVVAGIIIFLVCREIVTWYWKTTELVELMKRNNQLLEIIAKNTTDPALLEKAAPPTTYRQQAPQR